MTKTSSPFPNLKVGPYLYDDVLWCLAEPLTVEKGPLGYDIQQHMFVGGEVQADLQGSADRAQPGVRYASKLDLGAEAIAESQAVFNQADAGDPEPRQGIGIALLRRIEPGGTRTDRRIPLDGLDEAHLMDNLTSALLSWHAQTFGPAPEPEPSKPSKRRP